MVAQSAATIVVATPSLFHSSISASTVSTLSRPLVAPGTKMCTSEPSSYSSMPSPSLSVIPISANSFHAASLSGPR